MIVCEQCKWRAHCPNNIPEGCVEFDQRDPTLEERIAALEAQVAALKAKLNELILIVNEKM